MHSVFDLLSPAAFGRDCIGLDWFLYDESATACPLEARLA